MVNKDFKVSRRSFLKWSAAVAGSSTLVGCMPLTSGAGAEPAVAQAGNRHLDAEIKPSICWHNCGGRCQIKAQVKDGVVLSFVTDNEGPDTPDNLQARACLKGRSQRQRLYHPDRLKYPMKRVGERGAGQWEKISWEEALDTTASELKRIINQYGNESVYFIYASGVGGAFNQSYVGGASARLLNALGGYLSFYGNYSQANYMYAIPYMFGAGYGGSSPTSFSDAQLIVMFGDNPASTRVGGLNSTYYLKLAKENGTKVIVIDPRHSDTVGTFADQWIPIRPTTDAALVAGLAYVILTEELHDQAFLDKYCIGFDEEHMPEGVPAGNSYKSYLLGVSDGQPKTPQWASEITGVPVETIIQLAREIAGAKPCFILQGRGMQRHANGEFQALSVPLLALMTGNMGKLGANPGMYEGFTSVKMGAYPAGTNPIQTKVSFFMFTDAIEKGGNHTKENGGLQGADRLQHGIKFIWNYGGNALINQHSDTGRTTELLKDTSKCEFILGIENFMTPSMEYADIILPDITQFEQEDIVTRALGQGLALYGQKLVDPLYECKGVYEICTELAKRLGVLDKFDEGKSQEQYLRECVAVAQAAHPDFPSFEAFREKGIYKTKPKKVIAYQAFVEDPEKNPLQTPSGKVEIFSKTLYDMNNPERIPAVPKYVAVAEGPKGALKEKYPLQCIGHHSKRRVHSTFDNLPWMEEAEPQKLWLNPQDAAARGIEDDDTVKIFNDRGTVKVKVKVTPRLIPGVCSLPQGAWYTPDAQGVDTRGCINTLTTWEPTALAWGNPQHTNLVQVEKA
ncbi:anaerobic dimethyl sulfoxide reductase, A subunit, DmsA/YnfE family [Desulfitobacterium hafniense DCB-2]|uniref:Dimethyl sulfoxide reductase subunit A n=3 Tax=Desulfitobacterium hafniense TaxID=49338 RepID=A0A0W1JJL0_DESHA|nr:DMSO/selenate family reductase complex A subunit [Desulfitobacterium hafniense]ACL20590.1 anaerobic dimethyl sulfoxide reductase, A subunit, DmsA/YnfE family [Desulfitobacterium hafniense DCB-2]EHL08699.1 anaerobic dimethyl sulfoxide reductase, A subunit, DmsA/YnfE family [Desulfitobacterium hafniense DP7]KTE91368.1 dimethyl sulfoxide reductase subunit A [Desulfitobacterium hafniense]